MLDTAHKNAFLGTQRTDTYEQGQGRGSVSAYRSIETISKDVQIDIHIEGRA